MMTNIKNVLEKIKTEGNFLTMIFPQKSLSGGGYEYEYKGVFNLWRCPIETIKQYDKEDKLYYTSNGGIRLKRYLDELQGLPCQTIWTDINPVNSQANEKIGYPTQKPETLLERIIKCSTNENDIVLDPFAGGGTTVAVADKLNRQWIGIDQSVQAIKVSELRLNKQQDLFSNSFTLQLHKYDFDTLRYKDAFEFESWIVQQFGGTSNTKQRGDMGLDGKAIDGSPIQVKRQDNVGRNVIDNFHSAVMRYDEKLYVKNKAEQKPVGYIIAFSFGKGAIEEVARLKNHGNIIIKLVRVDEIVPLAKKPTITIEINELSKDQKGTREIEFIANGKSDAGIEFFSWDFEYNNEKGFKANIIIDKEGKQKYKFKVGQHTIAVKVFDNDGLENIEIIKLKINGKIEIENKSTPNCT
jgi:site-specific DNA-methyltransferase (adenine-specific)